MLLLCDGVAIHGAQIGGLRVLQTTHKNSEVIEALDLLQKKKRKEKKIVCMKRGEKEIMLPSSVILIIF